MTDRYFEGRAQRMVCEFKVGDFIDLQGDMYADPGHYNGNQTSEFEFEFEEVLAVTVGAGKCICVDFVSGFSCGFPPDHWIDVDGEQERPSSIG
jgi:hypothetical protein